MTMEHFTAACTGAAALFLLARLRVHRATTANNNPDDASHLHVPVVLTYLVGAKGLGENIRLVLHCGSVPFVDERITYTQVKQRRADGLLPCGQVPTLRVGGRTYCQSAAILRWAGRRAGLYPECAEEQLRCDMVCDALDELRRDLNPLWYKAALRRDPVSGEPGCPLTHGQVVEAQTLVAAHYLPAGFVRLEEILGDRPYFCSARSPEEAQGGVGQGGVGQEQLTVADVALFVDVSQILGGEFEESLGIGAEVLKDCPRLVALCGRVGRHPKVKEWYASRQ